MIDLPIFMYTEVYSIQNKPFQNLNKTTLNLIEASLYGYAGVADL